MSEFDATIHKSNEWLTRMAQELDWATDTHAAYQAMRAGLHAVRDRLTPEEAAHLSAQLPMLIRGLYYEGWHPADKPLKMRDRESFFNYITQALSDVRPVDPEQVTRALFRVLDDNITGGEVEHVKSMLPEELVTMWQTES